MPARNFAGLRRLCPSDKEIWPYRRGAAGKLTAATSKMIAAGRSKTSHHWFLARSLLPKLGNDALCGLSNSAEEDVSWLIIASAKSDPKSPPVKQLHS